MNMNISGYGVNTQFSRTNQPKGKNGRKPSKLRRFIKENNVSSADVHCLFSNFLFKYSYKEITEILEKDGKTKLPFLAYGLLQTAIEDVKNNRLSAIELMLRYSVQLPKQVQETTVIPDKGFNDLSPDEVKARLTEMIFDLVKDEYFRGIMKKAIAEKE